HRDQDKQVAVIEEERPVEIKPPPPAPIVNEPKKDEIKMIRIKVIDSQTKEAIKAMVLEIRDDGQTNMKFEEDEKGFLMEFNEKNVTIYYRELNGSITKPRKYDLEAILPDAKDIPTLLIPVDAIRVNNPIEMAPFFFKK